MSFKHLFIAFSFLYAISVLAEVKTEQNLTVEKRQELDLKAKKIDSLIVRKKALEQNLLNNNIWSKIYSNYHTYNEVKEQEKELSAKILRLETMKSLTQKQKKQLAGYIREEVTLLDKLQLLKGYAKDPFKQFLTPPNIEAVPQVENPFAVIGALSYKEKLRSDQKLYDSRYTSLRNILKKFKNLEIILEELLILEPSNQDYVNELADTKDQIKTFEPVIEIFKTTQNVYSKKIDEIELSLKSNVKRELEKTFTTAGIILFFIFILFLIKYIVKRYMSDNDRFYSINKALNISFMTILIFTLLLTYIENVSYLVTILGFASAGIAIAMKDWFMSLLGWATLVLGGAIHVGDRVRFVREGIEYVGDIVDISMLRMTMHEDINLTSFMTNRRAGRMIFIPNNYIFTDMIANYSHSGLKTVWDGIDFVITFDSDANRATQIAKEVTKKYSKGYTEITRKQLNKLRSKYGMRNTNVEPRIFVHIEPYGLKISAWYLTNSYATMTLRSTISIEIISRIQEEEKIELAFPTQSIYMDKNVPKHEFNPNNILPNEEI
ncbi:MAG: hypothetical protein COB07_06055 [Sulfurovum sp.]|nr:MAG: hypothetical protein COB07_06055 [Sulfurovum sp.]